eukprot:CAMPEP_0170738322 /NCGR_PEP_ID=MMETSP0437-20130122/4586_1 /TAXON_ID=0 /ORGANISM="Sexangularia sp." /LENGTH=146 /DNA_ID=CAMNT_0011076743 /DNA_START=87 /DNA_END=527 /DNA_ORIENTATION=+
MSITPKNISPDVFIAEYAKHLKRSGLVKNPKGVTHIKTAAHKELPPCDKDWFYTRAAAIARKVYLTKNRGVGSMRREFGGNANNGVRPNHQSLAAGGNIRYAMLQLEKAGIVAKSKSIRGGRVITPKGQRDLDRIATRISKKRLRK